MFRELFNSSRLVASRWSLIVSAAVLAFSSTPTAQAQATWTTTGTSTYCITCNVGIATSGPTQRLHFGAGNIQLPSANGGTDGNIYLGGITYNQQSGMRIFGGLVNGSYDGSFIDVRTSVLANGLIIRVDNVQGGTERMRVTADGRVGIGTPSPSTALHVVGDLTVTGNVSAKYQDLAEWVPARERLASGTVVVLDESEANHVTASKRAYDTKVAGVISGRPGLILGEKGTGKALVATTGRVKVRVDARRGPIRIGDLLVTSDHPGAAMRSEPVDVAGVTMHRPGTLIGKALENFPEGEGEILVLLSLQ